MNLFRNHWYDIGGILAIFTLIYLYFFYTNLSGYKILMWLSLVSLFLHQLEEYRIVGTFPGMINRVIFKSNIPNRYPLNSNTSLIINVWMGWTLYLFAALAGEQLVWLGMATILVSLGNVIAHIFIFNIKGKTFYNAGMATSLLFFIPCIYFFFKIIQEGKMATTTDYIIGILLGLIINVLGIVKLISWLANKDSTFVFRDNQLLKVDRKNVHGLNK
ncbi:MAG: HXXEE domain-containing protein [Bacteroidetes bacterium]|nr:HXXEE domain-containing protein [Bacteroidota bacterium]MBS1757978.1 HXXEE domain-containing protein [Bacteroidota bacterium]